MWLNPQETADLVTFTEEILNGKRHILCSGSIFSEGPGAGSGLLFKVCPFTPINWNHVYLSNY